MEINTDISVIICAYTEERWGNLLSAIRSVQRQETKPREIIVVVDHNPALFEHVSREVPEVSVLQNSESQGLSGARNTGVVAAQGDVIAFLDDDAVAAPSWLTELAYPYRRPNILGVGGSVQPAIRGGRPAWFPQEFDWVVGCTYRGMTETTAPVRNPIGANMSFRRQVFETVGGFRIGRVGTRLGQEDDETEFCIRAHQRMPKAILLHEPNARVFHDVPASRASWRYFARRCYSEGISKSNMARLVGARDGLASERAYVVRTLPLGVWQGLVDGAHGDLAGLARAGAIIAGLTITSAGYLAGTARIAINRLTQRGARREAGRPGDWIEHGRSAHRVA